MVGAGREGGEGLTGSHRTYTGKGFSYSYHRWIDDWRRRKRTLGRCVL